jgi:hypothetical protein
MFELQYQTSRLTLQLKVDATMLWTIIQVLVLATQTLNDFIA